jgi:hypothetical protein
MTSSTNVKNQVNGTTASSEVSVVLGAEYSKIFSADATKTSTSSSTTSSTNSSGGGDFFSGVVQFLTSAASAIAAVTTPLTAISGIFAAAGKLLGKKT